MTSLNKTNNFNNITYPQLHIYKWYNSQKFYRKNVPRNSQTSQTYWKKIINVSSFCMKVSFFLKYLEVIYHLWISFTFRQIFIAISSQSKISSGHVQLCENYQFFSNRWKEQYQIELKMYFIGIFLLTRSTHSFFSFGTVLIL